MLIRSLILVALLFGSSRARAGILAQFDFQIGTLDVELFDVDKPATVRNFLLYQGAGFWSRTLMHRWVQDFVIQGGAYGEISPGVPAFINPASPVTNEFSVGRRFSNVYGTIAMARSAGGTNSATSSWYFNVKDNVDLDSVDGGFTVFGRTLRGTNILNRFKLPEGATNFWFARSGTNVTETPLYVTNNVTNYVWVDVRLLTASIARVPAGNQISWRSVEGRPNILDFSNVIPPVWQPLQTNIGTGALMSITNNPGEDKIRHYRVRIDYTN